MTEAPPVAQARPLDPPMVPPDLVQPRRQRPAQPTSLEDLPIAGRQSDLPNLLSMRVFEPVLRRGPADPAMAAPDSAKPKAPRVVQPPDDVAAKVAQAGLEQLPLARRSLELPNLVPLTEVGPVLQPHRPDPAVGLPDSVRPEEKEPLRMSDGAAAQTQEPGLGSLPVSRPPSQLPKPAPATSDRDSQPRPQEEGDGVPEALKPEAPRTSQPPGAQPAQPAFEPLPLKPNELWKLAPAAPLPMRATSPGDLLSLTPTPAWPRQRVEIPEGESRGRFAISPEANPAASGTAPGSAPGRATNSRPPSVVTVAFGSGGAGEAGDSAGGQEGGGAVVESERRSGAGSGSGRGSGSGAGSGPGTGPFAGITVVGGIAGGETDDSRTGAGPGQSPFSGITVVGGVEGNSTGRDPVADRRKPRPLPTNYEYSVVATERSGGGLPYIGVFSNQQVHTVYLDMRQKETQAADFWTLAFAEPREPAAWADPAQPLEEESRHEFVKPLPAVKERPALPLDLVRQWRGAVIIVYGVIDVEGKMQELSVKQSPDPLFNQLVLEALGKWVFQPGALNGEPVAVKALVGIPLR